MLKPIHALDTWEAINSFSNWLSALGTISAVVAALWLANRDRRVSLDGRFSIGMIPSSNPNILDRVVFIINFTNTGVRPLTITNHYWKLPWKNSISFMFPQMEATIGRLCSTMPLELTDGKSGIIIYRKDFLKDLKIEGPFLFHPNKYMTWLRIRLFKIYLSTSVGKKIKVKIDRSVRAEFWKQYLKTSGPS
jgi:hypothetical protein